MDSLHVYVALEHFLSLQSAVAEGATAAEPGESRVPLNKADVHCVFSTGNLELRVKGVHIIRSDWKLYAPVNVEESTWYLLENKYVLTFFDLFTFVNYLYS